MQDIGIPVPNDGELTFTRCDICDEAYKAHECEISNPTSAVPQAELDQQEPLLLLCSPCREVLGVLH